MTVDLSFPVVPLTLVKEQQDESDCTLEVWAKYKLHDSTDGVGEVRFLSQLLDSQVFKMVLLNR